MPDKHKTEEPINEIIYSKTGIYLILILLIMLIINMASGVYTYNASNKIKKQLDSIAGSYNRVLNQEELQLKDKAHIKQSLSIQSSEASFKNDIEEDKEIARLISIIESSGLEKLARMKDFDPDVFQALMRHNIREQQLEYFRQKAQEQVEMDRKKYGNEPELLASLSASRVVRPTRVMTEEEFRELMSKRQDESNKALDELISKYPDSYVTARNLYSRILKLSNSIGSEKYIQRSIKMAQERGDTQSVERLTKLLDTRKESQDTEDVEMYYNMLKGFEERNSTIFLSSGFEAMPDLELRLAQAYHRAGNMDKFNNILENLKTKYSNENLVRYGAGMLGQTPQSVPEAIENLLKYTTNKND